jgi:hypothetical protein
MFLQSTPLAAIHLVLVFVGFTPLAARAHIAAWTPGIFQCGGEADQNNNLPVMPVYMRPKFGQDGWWMHGSGVRLVQYLMWPLMGD